MASRLYRDDKNTPVQLMKLGTTETIAITSTSSSSTEFTSSGVVRVVGSSLCHINISEDGVATADDPLLVNLNPEFFIVTKGEIISVLLNADDTTDGTLYITTMGQKNS